ncbi:MAG: TIGR01458 family HAD-type hydrolase [Janthinobacterium lividum]
MRFDTLLSDIDGTLMHKGEALPGAAQAIHAMRDAGIKIRFLTNVTAKMPTTLAGELCAAGISVSADEIQTATTACIDYLKQRPGQRCHLIIPADIRPAFHEIEIDDVHPDIVVIGDIGEAFDYAKLNGAFRMIREGAQLLALQKNLFWFAQEGVRLDCGAFIVGLEAAANVRALVTGKPSPMFFEGALRHLDSLPGRTIVLGDDVLTDMAGARAIGAHALLVKTGKFQPDLFSQHRAQVDSVIDSIAALPEWLKTAQAS